LRRKFLVNIIFLLTVSIIVKALWVLGIDRTVQNVVGETSYGSYFSLFSFSVLFTLILDMGLSGFNNRAISADPTRVKIYFGNVLLLRLMLTAAYFAVTFSVALAIGYNRWQYTILLVLMANQVMAAMIMWLRSNISGMQYLILDSLLSVSDRLVMIIICSLLLWGNVTTGPFRIEWFVYAQTASYFIVMVLSFIIVIRRGKVLNVKPDGAVLKRIVISGLPFALVAFTMTVYWRIDSVLIERLLPAGATEAGNYAQAFRLFDAFSMIPVMFGSLLLPIMSKELAAHNSVAPLASMAGRMLITPAALGAVTFAAYPEQILDLLYKSPSAGAVHAFTILMLTLMPVSVIYIYSTILTAAGRMKTLGLITLAGMVMNIVVNLVLIPQLASVGAATAALCTQLLVAAACVITVERSMTRVIASRRLLPFLLMLSLTFAAGRLLRMTHMPWFIAAAIQLAAGLVFALAFRMIEPLKSLKLLAGRRNSA